MMLKLIEETSSKSYTISFKVDSLTNDNEVDTLSKKPWLLDVANSPDELFSKVSTCKYVVGNLNVIISYH